MARPVAEFKCGVGVGDITPAPGGALGGYWQRVRGADSVVDPLKAKALVWRGEGGQGALVALDLIGVASTTVRILRQEIEKRVGVEAAGVMVCCSHTHAGPLSLPMRGMGQVDQAYMERVVETAVECVRLGLESLRPATLRYARPEARLGQNRRGGDSAVPYAHAAFFEADEGPLATLFSHPCHPVHLGPADYLLSADFPGASAAVLEDALGAPALFVNGACGDVNPPRPHAGQEAARALGERLAAVVLECRDAAVRLACDTVRCARASLCLPLQPPPARWRLAATRAFLGFKTAVKGLAGRPAPWLEGQRQWAAAAARERGGGEQVFEIQALRLGGLCLLGMEGELFARYQLDIERDAPATILCGYANGCIGYVPTADEYGRGGYEIEEAHKVYPAVRPLAPESEGVVRYAALDLLRQVAGD